MIVEGRNAVREALRGNATIEKIVVAKGSIDNSVSVLVAQAKQRNIEVRYVDKSVLDKQSVTKHHQGIMAYTTEFVYSSLQDILAAKKGEYHYILLLDGIEDPHNLGSIIRVADCMGVDGIVIPERRQASVNETVIRASCGATQYVAVAKVGNINDAIRQLQDEFVRVLALDMDGEPLAKSNLKGDIAIVVGNEGKGVKALTKKLCDGVISIPMYGNIDSLNASVATGIALYAATQQRR